jgi:hypothetical protein
VLLKTGSEYGEHWVRMASVVSHRAAEADTVHLRLGDLRGSGQAVDRIGSRSAERGCRHDVLESCLHPFSGDKLLLSNYSTAEQEVSQSKFSGTLSRNA